MMKMNKSWKNNTVHLMDMNKFKLISKVIKKLLNPKSLFKPKMLNLHHNLHHLLNQLKQVTVQQHLLQQHQHLQQQPLLLLLNLQNLQQQAKHNLQDYLIKDQLFQSQILLLIHFKQQILLKRSVIMLMKISKEQRIQQEKLAS